MKAFRFLRIIALLAIGLTGALPAFGKEPMTLWPETAREAAELIARLPSQQELDDAFRTIHEAKDAARVEKAVQTSREAQEISLKLRPMLKPGYSMLGYTGLLARGTIDYYARSEHYLLRIRTHPSVTTKEQNFEVLFNRDGVILRVGSISGKE